MTKLILLGTLLVGLTACFEKAEITIGVVGDTMAFDKPVLNVKAGQGVKLTFKNTATSPAMLHDFVLTERGAEIEVVNASMSAGSAKGYYADSPKVIAHTKLLKPGESETISFSAPSSPGEYPYFCTFPGHFPLMKGSLKVQ
jgi:azurin